MFVYNRGVVLRGAEGVPTYWLLDPVWLRVTVLALEDGLYVERARHEGPVFTAQEPFPVTLRLEAD